LISFLIYKKYHQKVKEQYHVVMKNFVVRKKISQGTKGKEPLAAYAAKGSCRKKQPNTFRSSVSSERLS